MTTDHSSLLAIDLGNTSVRVARLDASGQIEVLRNGLGEDSTPLAVLFDDDRVVVGKRARKSAALRPDRVAMGFRDSLADSDFRVEIDGASHTAEELVGLVLRQATADADEATGQRMRDVVLTCPAWFDGPRRAALVDAARRAELSVVQLIDDPRAIALSPGLALTAGRSALVCDLGGSSLQVSILEPRGESVEVPAVRGDRHLGGRDWDHAVVQWMAEEFRRSTGSSADPLDDPETLQDWMLRAEHAKIALSRQREVHVDCRHAGHSVELSLDRAAFEDRTRPLADRLCTVVLETLQDWRSTVGREADQILLAGGAAPTPGVASRLTEMLGRDVEPLPNPGEAVVRGAARWAAALSAEQDLRAHRQESEAVPSQKTSGVPGEAEPPRSGACEAPLDDDVEFTVYRPRVVTPQRWHTLLAFAHRSELPDDAPPDEPDPVAEVRRQALQVLGPDRIDQYKPSTQESRLAVPRAGELTMVPYLPGFECNPPRHTFLWQENVHRCEFRIRAGAHLDGQTVSGNLSVYLGSIVVADVTLKIRVDSGHVDAASRPAAEKSGSRLYKKIFASYSHRDLVIVEQFERLHRALGDRVLRDWNELRAGEEWNERLREMIVEADVFQLFWSRHAMLSPFVRQEYEFAVSLNRPSFVRPCYWEDPFPESPAGELPPPTLRRFHFHKLELTPLSTVERDAQPPDAPSPPGSAVLEQQTPAAPPTVEPPPTPQSPSARKPAPSALPAVEPRSLGPSVRRSVASAVGRAVRAAGGALGRLIPRSSRPESRLNDLTSRRDQGVLQRSSASMLPSERSAAGRNHGTVSRWLRAGGFQCVRARQILFAATLACALVAGAAGWSAASDVLGTPVLRPAVAVAAGIAGACLPWAVVLWRRWRRRAEMRRFVREAVPLMVIAARSGLGIAGVLWHVIADLEGTFPRAAAEWRIASHQMMLGCAVEEALRDLADRVDLDEVARLTRALRYAHRFGEPLEQALWMLDSDSPSTSPVDTPDGGAPPRP